MTGISDFRCGAPRCFHPMDSCEGASAWQRMRKRNGRDLVRPTSTDRLTACRSILESCGLHAQPLSRNRNPLTSEGQSAIPYPHGCKPPQRTSKPPRIGPLATTSKRPVRFGNPMLSASSRVKMPAKWPATSLAFSPCCASGHAESGSVQDAESLRQLRHPHGGSVEDHARVRRQKIKCSLDAELICSLERGLIQYAVAVRGRT
jgi:hypothetical protein